MSLQTYVDGGLVSRSSRYIVRFDMDDWRGMLEDYHAHRSGAGRLPIPGEWVTHVTRRGKGFVVAADHELKFLIVLWSDEPREPC